MLVFATYGYTRKFSLVLEMLTNCLAFLGNEDHASKWLHYVGLPWVLLEMGVSSTLTWWSCVVVFSSQGGSTLAIGVGGGSFPSYKVRGVVALVSISMSPVLDSHPSPIFLTVLKTIMAISILGAYAQMQCEEAYCTNRSTLPFHSPVGPEDGKYS